MVGAESSRLRALGKALLDFEWAMHSTSDLAGPLSGLLAPKRKETQNKVLSKVFESLICSICQDYMYVPMMIQCGHNFCYGCLLTWFNSNPEEEITCPHCRGCVINMPCLNSALQQWLHFVIEALELEEGDDREKSKISKILSAKGLSESEYKQDIKKEILFNGVFKNSAVGVEDEDDDGILRCSNCHWELEDDEDDVCPHCQFRIRGRARQTQPQSGDEEGETSEGDIESLGVCMLYVNLDYEYATRVDGVVKRLTDFADILNEDTDTSSPFGFRETTLSDGSIFHYPSYSVYLQLTFGGPLNDRKRAIEITREVEELNICDRNSELDDYTCRRFRAFRDMAGPLTKNQFQAEVLNCAAAAAAYEKLIHEKAQKPIDEGESSSDVFKFNYPFLVDRMTDVDGRIVLPSFSLFVEADNSMEVMEQKDEILVLLRRMEDFVSRGGHFSEFKRRIHAHGTAELSEDDDSLQDFIASDEEDDMVDHAAVGRVIDLEAEDSDHSDIRPSEGSSENSSGEEPDSDYYERNEGDGYVSGDSLNDEDDTARTEFPAESEDEAQDDDDDDDDDQDEDETSRVRIPRKRNRAIVEASDEEDSDD